MFASSRVASEFALVRWGDNEPKSNSPVTCVVVLLLFSPLTHTDAHTASPLSLVRECAAGGNQQQQQHPHPMFFAASRAKQGQSSTIISFDPIPPSERSHPPPRLSARTSHNQNITTSINPCKTLITSVRFFRSGRVPLTPRSLHTARGACIYSKHRSIVDEKQTETTTTIGEITNRDQINPPKNIINSVVTTLIVERAQTRLIPGSEPVQ